MVERKGDGIHGSHVRLVGCEWMRAGRRVIKLLLENKKRKNKLKKKDSPHSSLLNRFIKAWRHVYAVLRCQSRRWTAFRVSFKS